MLTRLHVQNLRNLADVQLSGLASVNIFFGANGSGKTSLLEALHLLSTGRSFRSTQVRPVIRHGMEQLLVFGEVREPHGLSRLGIQRSLQGRPEIHIDGQAVSTVAELAQALPMQVINSESFGLIEGAPALRRQWMDWAMFHVEPSFHEVWRSATRALRQRNALIRHGRMDQFSLDLWDREYGRLGSELSELRARHFESLQAGVIESLAALGEKYARSITLDLQRGWPQDQGLEDYLKANRERDTSGGHTRYGPHRADVRVKVDGLSASDVLSRGQTKVLVCAMKLAQMDLVKRLSRRSSVVLIDDLAAELDKEHRRRLCRALESRDSQVFLTAVAREDLDGFWEEEARTAWFHVEHGQVAAAVDNSAV